MRLRLSCLVLTAAAVTVALASAAGASRTSAAAKAVRVQGPSFKVTFPQSGQAQMTLETIHVTVPKGATVKSLSVKPANASSLPEQVAIAAAVGPKTVGKRSATFKVYVFMQAFLGGASKLGARPSATPENFVDVETGILEVLAHLVAHRSHYPTAFTAFDHGIQSCELAYDAGFYGDGIWSDEAWASLQSSFNQPSPPEGVIDDIVSKACSGQAEGAQGELPEAYDSGND